MISEAKKDDLPMGASMEAFTDQVRDTAYLLWEQDGRPEGRADEYWFRALDQHIQARANEEARTGSPEQQPKSVLKRPAD